MGKTSEGTLSEGHMSPGTMRRSGPQFLPSALAVTALALNLTISNAVAQSSTNATPTAGGSSGGSSSIVIKGHAQTVSQSVKDANVRIVGDANTVTLNGTLKSLTISGDENGVRVEKVKSITTKGDGNLVKWKSGLKPGSAPIVSNVGDHNNVEKDDGGSLTPPKNDDMDTSKAPKTGR